MNSLGDAAVLAGPLAGLDLALIFGFFGMAVFVCCPGGVGAPSMAKPDLRR
jgi:hypothetical protein